MTTENFRYDFNLSKSVCVSLEDVVSRLNTAVISCEADNLELLNTSWSSESAEQFAAKYTQVMADVRKIRDELNNQIEQIKQTSKSMYLLEQDAAQKIAAEEQLL